MRKTSKPKIGIFTKPIDQGTSGSGSHLRQLVSHILKLNQKFDIILIHYSKNDNEIYKKTSELIIPKNPFFAHLKLRKENFDVLHYYPLTILSPIWLRTPKKVTTVHGGGAAELYFPDQFSKLKRIHSKLVKPFYFRKMDYIFSGSKAGKSFVTYQYKVQENKVFFTHSAVDSNFRVYGKNPEQIKEKYGISPPFVFHLSKFSKRKNPWTILKAFSIIHRERKDLKLVLGGKGWENNKVIQFAQSEKILNSIIFTGFLPVEDVIILLNNAEIFLFPSFFEGFGMPNLEAMACGCPVITSRAFAIPEIVADAALILKDNTDPLELASKIVLLLEDESLRKQLIQKGLDRIKLYSWEKSALTVLEIYEKCLKNKKS
jgi:glycosyltransferase involved in cell wall biosynthesis